MLPYQESTHKIIGCCFEVINELGAGFIESVYEKALFIALQEKGLHAEEQVPLNVFFRKHNVGHFIADIIVEKVVLLELKAVKKLLPEHQAQVINYLKATGLEVGLLINFGSAKLEYKRLYGKRLNTDKQDEQDKKN
ncbi:MAG: GxxExxY protein [Calditrichaeota bacterium]|nr:GxxExxY protein [Calditrichota bacterium]